MADTDGVQNARNDLAADQPVIEVDVDREKGADYGSSQAEVGQAIAAALHGVEAGTITLNGQERDITLAPTHPDATRRDPCLELPVTEVQTQNARRMRPIGSRRRPMPAPRRPSARPQTNRPSSSNPLARPVTMPPTSSKRPARPCAMPRIRLWLPAQ